jgi:hypothetical protein
MEYMALCILIGQLYELVDTHWLTNDLVNCDWLRNDLVNCNWLRNDPVNCDWLCFRSSLRNLLVIMPVMGVTWIFGVFMVSEGVTNTVFQYIFVIANSLQV